jgi:plasmid maintenance system antidote protein VapI
VPDKIRSTAASEVLAQALSVREVNQKSLAKGLDVTPTYVSALLAGRKGMSADTADRIVGVLGLTPAEALALHRAAALDQGFRLDLPDGF